VSVALPGLEVARRSQAAKIAPGVLAVLLLMIVAPLAILSSQQSTQDFATGGLPAGAQPFVSIYRDAARAFQVSPFLLMAVHEDETNYSLSPLPGVADGLNLALCCAGPMQFSITGAASNAAGGRGGTWAAFSHAYRRARVPRPASYPGRYTAHNPNVYDSYDAIYGAAAYLRSLGAGPNLDDRTLNALASYKGTPPASLPYARHDYTRAQELQQLAAAQQANGGIELGNGASVNGSATQLLANRRVSLSPAAQGDLRGHRVSPRLIALLDLISQRHSIAVSVLSAGHAPGTNHQPGRAADIAVVDGEVCNALAHGRNGNCWALAQELDALKGCMHPTELIYYFDPGPSPDSFARADHADHVHAGWDGPLGSVHTYDPNLSPCAPAAVG
jgi:hypothetical protein